MSPTLNATHTALPDTIRALLDPAIYPHPAPDIQLVQTHISYVILAGDYVYKLRKPVDFGFLDFSTPRKRLNDCRQEIALNSRLCPDVYLGVVPITRDGEQVALAGHGRAVDYAVKMRRLPAERMMDRLLETGRLTAEMLERLAERIAAFHAASERGPAIDQFGTREAIERNWAENFAQTQPYIGRTLSADDYHRLRTWVAAVMQRERALFARRVAEGRIRDCHGDLRASSVCFVDGICVFDCIEFNRRFRYSDVAADVAFLAMDLRLRGRPDLAGVFVDRYIAASGDEELRAVLPFYICYRAFVRGKVESFRLDEPEVDDIDKAEAADLASRCFALAAESAGAYTVPALVITCGLSGTGKTALATELAERLGVAVISSDVVRKGLAGVPPTERHAEDYGHGLYAPRLTARTYAELLRRARAELSAGRSVIIDATFADAARRARARTAAEHAGAAFLCLECAASEAAVRERLAKRERDPRAVSDAGWEVYLAQRAAFDPVTELDAWQHAVIDTDRPLAECAAQAECEVRRRLLP